MCLLKAILLVDVLNLIFCFVSSFDQIYLPTDSSNFGRSHIFSYKTNDKKRPETSTVIQRSLTDDASNINEEETGINFRIALDEVPGDAKPGLDETKDSRQPIEESQVELRSRLDNKQWIQGLSLRQKRLKLFTPYDNEAQGTLDAEEEYIKMQDQLVLDERQQRLKILRMQQTTQTIGIPINNLDSNAHKLEIMQNFSNPSQAQVQNPTLLQKKILEEQLARLNQVLKQEEIMQQQQLLRQLYSEQQQLQQQKVDQQQQQQQLSEQQLPQQKLPVQQAVEQLIEKQQLPAEQQPNQQLTDQQLAEQQQLDQELSVQELSDQEVAEELSGQDLAEQVSYQEGADQPLVDQEEEGQQLLNQEEAEQLSDQEEELSDLEEQQQVRHKQSEEKKLKSSTVPHGSIMRQRHTNIHANHHSKYIDVETTTREHKSRPIARITAGFESDDHTERKRKRHKSHKTIKSNKRKRHKKRPYKSDSFESDQVVDPQKSKKKKEKQKDQGVVKYKSDNADFEAEQESFEAVTEVQSIELEAPNESLLIEQAIEWGDLEGDIESEHFEVTDPESLELSMKPQLGGLEAVKEPKSEEFVAVQDSLAVSKVTEPNLIVPSKFLEIPLVSQIQEVKQDTTNTLQATTKASIATMTSVQQIINQTIPVSNVLRRETTLSETKQTRKFIKKIVVHKENNLADKLSFHEIFFKPNSIGRNIQINTFTTHILASAIKIFDVMKEKTFNENIRKRLDWVAASYDAKYRSFLQDLLKHPIKTRLGTQKVILNSIDESDRILRRLLNFVVNDLDGNGSLRQNLHIAQSLLDEVAHERKSQLTHACKKFGICKSEGGYSQFLIGVSNVMLKVDAERFQRALDAFTETAKYVNFDNIFDPNTCRLISQTITYMESENIETLKTKFKIIKNIISNRNKPLIVTKSEARYCRLNSTVALLEILNILEEKVPRTDDNIVDWGDITLAFKDWSDYNKPDIQEVMGTFLQYVKSTLVQMIPTVQKRIEKYFNRIVLTVN